MSGEKMSSFHLDTMLWLKTLELEEYSTLFMQYPYVETLLHLDEKDFQGLGISNAAHRARLSSNIVYIREKLKRSSNGLQLTNGSSRLSYTSPPSSPSPWITNNHCRYSTIPEGKTTHEALKTPVRKKMELKDTSPEELRKELEEELKLPNDDVRSHAWFHGGISREKAEKQIRENGDFLVRDSISRPGNFVVTVRWKNVAMHFVINRVVMQADSPYASVQYQFEKECFSCIPSLVRYHVGNCKPVSQQSGAVIQRPVNRTMPLSYTDGKYAEFNRVQGNNANHIYSAVPKKVVTPKSLNGSPMRQRCDSQPSVFINRPNVLERTQVMERSGSQPLLDVKPIAQQLNLSQDDERPLERTGSEPILSPTVERRQSYNSSNCDYAETRPIFGSDSKIAIKQSPPCKPIRTLDVREHTYQEIPLPDSKGTMTGTTTRISILHDHDTTPPKYILPDENHVNEIDLKKRQRIVSDTRMSMLDRNSMIDCNYSVVGKEHFKSVEKLVPINETSSVFKPLDVQTSFFGTENKPLEASAMAEMKRILLEEEPLLLAKHMTSVDLEVCRILQTGCNTLPGLELITLPPGRQLRLDILERYNCLKTWLAISLLTTVEKDTRTKMLSQWIQIAECLRSNMGNMFGFAAIMDGVGSRQVCNLKQTWEWLRTKYTSTAVSYETKLRSLLKSLNNGENVISLTKTSIPHIIPVIQVLERDWSTLDLHDWTQPASQDVLDRLPQGESWEDSANCFGMDPMLNHLQNAHMFAQQGKMFRINADAKLGKFLPDEDMRVMFRTDFHMRLLWGSKGALVNKEERYHKFERVLTVMSEKLEQI